MKRKMFLLTVLLVFCVMFMIGCKSAKKPNNTPETTGNDTTSSVQSPEQTTGAPETASPAVTTAKPAVTTAKPAVTTAKPAETTAPVVEKLPLGVKVTSISELEKLDAPTHKINVVKAFLEGDRKKMDELYTHRDDVFAQMPLLKISSFEAWSEKEKGSTDNTVFVTINVSESQLDTLPVGSHTLTVATFYAILEKMEHEEGTNRQPETETEAYMYSWFNNVGYIPRAEYMSGSTSSYVEFINSFYHFTRGVGGTKDEYIKHFKAIFGKDPGRALEDFLTFENDGKGEQRYGHGGLWYWYDFVESGDDYVTVQFYADHGYLLKGPKIKYNFVRIDGMLVFSSYRYLDSSYKEIGPAVYLQ